MSEAAPSAPVAVPESPTVEGGQVSEQAANPNPANGSETTAQKQARLLAEADMDSEIDLKINGQVTRKKLRDVVKTAQLQEASSKKFEDAKRLEHQARQILDAFRDPVTARGAIRELANAYKIPPAELAKALWDEEQADAAKSPEQRELEQLRRDKEFREQEEKRRLEEQQAEHLKRETAVYQDKLSRLYNAALDAHGFPKDPDLRAQAMGEMASRHKVDGELSFRENARITAESYQRRVQTFIRSMPVDKRPDLLDEETIAHLRNQQLQKRSQLIPPVDRNSDQPRGDDGKYVKRDEYRAVSVRSSFHDPE